MGGLRYQRDTKDGSGARRKSVVGPIKFSGNDVIFEEPVADTTQVIAHLQQVELS